MGQNPEAASSFTIRNCIRADAVDGMFAPNGQMQYYN